MAIKRLILCAFALGAIITPIFAFAQDTQKDKYGAFETAKRTRLLNLGISKTTPESLAQTVVSALLMFIGTIFFLLVLYAGLTWMTARGSSETVTRAKGILMMAITGLLIVAASYAISTFVFERLTTVPEETATTTPSATE